MRVFLLSLILLFPIFELSAQIDKRAIKQLLEETKTYTSNQRNRCDADDVNRSYDGSCNNINNPAWGQANIPLLRWLPAAYSIPDYNNSMGGLGRPNPRKISNEVSLQPVDRLNARDLSLLWTSFAQFLDHDISLTPSNNSEAMPIFLPSDELVFTAPIEFSRSQTAPNTGNGIPREQINTITAWIDASNVYGSDEHRANWLRTFRNGKLKTSRGDLLPYNTIDGERESPIDTSAPEMDGEDSRKIFVAGDARANEQPGLTSIHTLFVREHNHWCDMMVEFNYSDEVKYQVARKLVGATIQGIVYNEFLPALGVTLGAYQEYDSSVNGGIRNIFSTAGYRLGHTMIDDQINLVNNDFRLVNVLSLAQSFFNPTIVQENGIDPILMGLAVSTQQEVDPFVVDALRNFLFSPAPGSPGLDLVALNLQRGRDHGIPDYNTVRVAATNSFALTWEQVTSNTALQNRLRTAYGNNLNNIDLWIGLLSEDHLPNSSVGATLHEILKTQFEVLRDGDRFYYESDPLFAGDRTYWTNFFDEVTLSEVIYNNTNLTNIPYDAFFTEQQFFVIEENENKSVTSFATDATNIESSNNNKFLLFPNPADEDVRISLRLKKAMEVIIEVTTVTGQVITQLEQTFQSGLSIKNIPLSQIPAGIYVVHFKTKQGKLLDSQKLLVN